MTLAPSRQRGKADSGPTPTQLPRLKGLSIGSEPAVDLLPPEVRVNRKRAATVRRLGAVFVAVLGLTVIAVGATFLLNVVKQAELLAEQQRTSVLLQQQAQYAIVRVAQENIELVQAGQQIGASTEIDWATFLSAHVQPTIPGNVTLTDVAIDSASPLAEYQQSSIPLQGQRVATVTLTVTSETLPDLPPWLAALALLPGVTDTAPGTVSRGEDGTYTASVSLHLDSSAFDSRYVDEAAEDAAAGGEAADGAADGEGDE